MSSVGRVRFWSKTAAARNMVLSEFCCMGHSAGEGVSMYGSGGGGPGSGMRQDEHHIGSEEVAMRWKSAASMLIQKQIGHEMECMGTVRPTKKESGPS